MYFFTSPLLFQSPLASESTIVVDNGTVTRTDVTNDGSVTASEIPILVDHQPILVPETEGAVGGAAAPTTPAAAATAEQQNEDSERNSFTLTDDGVPVPTEMLKCPMCPAEFTVNMMLIFLKNIFFYSISCFLQIYRFFLFQPGSVRELEFHVDSHLSTESNCPVCALTFDKEDQENFEIHVQVKRKPDLGT